MAEKQHPSDVDEGMEGHAGLQSAERHEMEAVAGDEEEAEEAADRAESEEDTAERRKRQGR
jgi:hypothetical protein